MFIPQKYAAIAVKYTSAKIEKQGVVFDDRFLQYYINKIREMSKQDPTIREGQELPFNKWYDIYADITSMMDYATRRVSEMSANFKRDVKADEYILSALNYLIAVTEYELGSPELPIQNFREHYKGWAQNIVRAKPETNVALDATFDNQRGIDAFDLRHDVIQPLLDAINNNENVAENVGQLYAEYRALVNRQANHGFFWRLFHPFENTDRNDLISELETTLKRYAPNLTFDAKTELDPGNVVKSAEKERAAKGVDDEVNLYTSNASDKFGYSAYIANPDLFDKEAIIGDKIGEGDKAQDINVEDVKNSHSGEDVKESNLNEDNKLQDLNEGDKEQNPNEENPDNVNDEKKEKEDPNIDTAKYKFDALNNYAVRTELEDEIWDAISKYVSVAVNKRMVVPSIVSNMMNEASTFNEIYDYVNAQNNGNATVLNNLMHDSVKAFFADAFNNLDGCLMSSTNQVIAAQKMCDVILKKVTAVGFFSEKYYADESGKHHRCPCGDVEFGR